LFPRGKTLPRGSDFRRATSAVDKNNEAIMKRWFKDFRPDLGLLGNADFRRLWGSFTITTFGSQITNLALPLTAALLLHASPWQMGVLVALEVLPFGLLGLFAGVWIDRGSKLRIVIASEIGRGAARRC
jgi:hypothetical protein